MQSGISASQELHDAFNKLVSSSDERALIAGIEKEALVPLNTVPSSSSDFTDDLDALQGYLSPTKASYVLLKLDHSAQDGYAAVTYVPNAAPVRQKMLFASTRLNLARELGIERFRETLFVTEKEELTATGWAKHEKHGALEAPLTEEEQGLKGVKEAEAEESGGTGARRGHVSSKVSVKTDEGVLEALRKFNDDSSKGTLVQLKFDLQSEALHLDSTTPSLRPSDLAATISQTEPRYSFYSYPSSSSNAIVFIYTCPSGSKIKERMIYSTGKSWTRVVAERDAGIAVAKSLEATEPSEITEDMITKEFEEQKTESKGFARPKRPGRR